MLGLILRSGFYFFVKEWRERYPSAFAILGEIFSLGVSLAVYWYTAKAFSGHADFAGHDYFGYVVLGEATLLLPIGLVAAFPKTAREAQAEGVLEALLSLPWSRTRLLGLLGAPSVARELARAVLLLLVASFLGMRLDPRAWAAWLGLQAAALPVFFAMSMAAVSYFLRFGRGEGITAYACSIAAILAGTYFPTSLLPQGLKETLQIASPFNVLLEGSRAVVSHDTFQGTFQGAVDGLAWPAATLLLAWGALALPVAVLLLGLSLRSVRRRGSVEVTT